MTQAPCKDCTERNSECHAQCELYAKWNEIHIAEKKALERAKYPERMARRIEWNRKESKKKFYNGYYKPKEK